MPTSAYLLMATTAAVAGYDVVVVSGFYVVDAPITRPASVVATRRSTRNKRQTGKPGC